MADPRDITEGYQVESDSAAEEDSFSSIRTPPHSISIDTLSHRGRSGISTPTRIALGAAASRIAAPSPVVDPNGLGWPGNLSLQ